MASKLASRAHKKLLARAALDVPRSGIREVMDLAWALEAEGKKVLHLEVGQPDFAAPQHVIEATKGFLDEGHTKYIPNAGVPSLREAIASIYSNRAPNRAHSSENIMVTHGSMFAFSSAFMAALEPGDEVLLPDPGFPNYDMAALAINAVPVKYDLKASNDFFPDVSSLESLITPRTKMLMVNSPSNPTGQVYDQALMQELADFAERHGIFLMSDEIYSDMVFDGMDYAPTMLQCDFDPEMLLVVSGVAKNYAMTGEKT
jgi:aspartate/methionine/tyrosine aminotransferase